MGKEAVGATVCPTLIPSSPHSSPGPLCGPFPAQWELGSHGDGASGGYMGIPSGRPGGWRLGLERVIASLGSRNTWFEIPVLPSSHASVLPTAPRASLSVDLMHLVPQNRPPFSLLSASTISHSPWSSLLVSHLKDTENPAKTLRAAGSSSRGAGILAVRALTWI